MRIGVDIRSLLEENPSGVSFYTENILKKVLKTDRQNQYLFFLNKYNKTQRLEKINKIFNKQEYPNLKICIFSWPNRIFNIFSVVFKKPRADKMLGGVDIFWLPNLNFISLTRQCKKIISIHDLSFLSYQEFYSFKDRIWHKMIRPKKLIRSFDRIFSVSESTAQDVQNLLSVGKEKISVIHEGNNFEQYLNQELSPDVIKTVKDKYKKSHNLSSKFIFTLANLEPRKNIESLVIAFNQIKQQESSIFQDYQLVIAGGWGHKSKTIEKIISDSKYKKDIILLGFLPSEFGRLLFAFSYKHFS